MITTIDNEELVVGDHNAHFPEVKHLIHAYEAPEDGKVRSKGLIPRPMEWKPTSRPRKAIDLQPIPQDQWAGLLREQTAKGMRCSDVRLRGDAGKPIPSLDQDGVGYCWAHSSTSANTVLRARMNLPYVPLSAFAVAATIKKGADEGGWGALSMDFIMQRGQPNQSVWPQGDRNYRQHDTPDTWVDAAKHKVVNGWIDQGANPYDRNMAFGQRATLFLSTNPDVGDYNWWSHSVCGLDLVNGTSLLKRLRAANGKLLYRAGLNHLRLFEMAVGLHDPVTAGFGVRIWNSWNDSWSDRGMGVLTGSKAQADGCVAPVSTTPSEFRKLTFVRRRAA